VIKKKKRTQSREQRAVQLKLKGATQKVEAATQQQGDEDAEFGPAEERRGHGRHRLDTANYVKIIAGSWASASLE
jgi:hypothetical protein